MFDEIEKSEEFVTIMEKDCLGKIYKLLYYKISFITGSLLIICKELVLNKS